MLTSEPELLHTRVRTNLLMSGDGMFRFLNKKLFFFLQEKSFVLTETGVTFKLQLCFLRTDLCVSFIVSQHPDKKRKQTFLNHYL